MNRDPNQGEFLNVVRILFPVVACGLILFGVTRTFGAFGFMTAAIIMIIIYSPKDK